VKWLRPRVRMIGGESGVEGFVGRWGSGKTLMLSAVGLFGLRDPRCLGVWSTFPLFDAETGRRAFDLDPDRLSALLPELSLPPDLVRQGFYILALVDEAGVLMPSRMWDKLPMKFLATLAMGRKKGLRLRWAAQSEKRVDVVLRELTTTIWRCAKWHPFGLFGRPWCIRLRGYLPGESEDTADKTWEKSKGPQRRVWRLRAAMEAYDTLFVVSVADHLVDKARPVAAKAEAA